MLACQWHPFELRYTRTRDKIFDFSTHSMSLQNMYMKQRSWVAVLGAGIGLSGSSGFILITILPTSSAPYTTLSTLMVGIILIITGIALRHKEGNKRG